VADDMDVTPGIGAKSATDLISGVHYPRRKIVFGVDGTATDVSATDPLPVTLAGDSVTVATTPETVGQNSTTSGQSGNLVQGAVTTAAPTYTTAQTSPLSMTTAGALRVDGSGTTQPISGTVTAATPSASTSTVALTGSSQVVSATAKDYRGFTIRETSGTATALMRIWDNASAASGTCIEEISLVANESRSEFYGTGVKTLNGIYVQVSSGSISGSARTA